MKEIDFLPPNYRNRRKQLQTRPLRIGAIAVVICVLAVLTTLEYRAHRNAKSRLAKIEPAFAAAEMKKDILAQLQGRLERLNDDAALMTYLHHNWPRTRLIHEILAPMPESIGLKSLRVEEITPQGRRASSRLQSARRRAEEKKLENLSPAARDLFYLKEEDENLATMIWLEGTADDAEALHDYIGRLDDEPLLADVQLKQSRRAEGDDGNDLEFTVEITVSPAYGQQGGPVGEENPEDRQLIESLHRLTNL